MFTGIKKNEHSIADYIYVPLVWMAPKILGFSADKKTANLCRAFAATALGYTLFTNAKWGIVKLIPYKTHAAIDLASGVAALAVSQSPITASDSRAQKTFGLMGIIGITVGILSLIGAKHS